MSQAGLERLAGAGATSPIRLAARVITARGFAQGTPVAASCGWLRDSPRASDVSIVAISLVDCLVDRRRGHARPAAYLLAQRIQRGRCRPLPAPARYNEQVRAAIEALIGSLDPTLNRLLTATVDQTLAGWFATRGKRGHADRSPGPSAGRTDRAGASQHRSRACPDDRGQAGSQGRRPSQPSALGRGGMVLVRFHESCGWREIGRWPEALCLGENELREEVLMHLPLR